MVSFNLWIVVTHNQCKHVIIYSSAGRISASRIVLIAFEFIPSSTVFSLLCRHRLISSSDFPSVYLQLEFPFALIAFAFPHAFNCLDWCFLHQCRITFIFEINHKIDQNLFCRLPGTFSGISSVASQSSRNLWIEKLNVGTSIDPILHPKFWRRCQGGTQGMDIGDLLHLVSISSPSFSCNFMFFEFISFLHFYFKVSRFI